MLQNKKMMVCNNSDKPWRPYGEPDTQCDLHEPHTLAGDRHEVTFTCTDINYRERKCRLQDYIEYEALKSLRNKGLKNTDAKKVYTLLKDGVTPGEYKEYFDTIEEIKNKIHINMNDC